MKKRADIKELKKKKKRHKKMLYSLAIILLLLSFILIFNEQLTTFIMSFNKEPRIINTTKEEIKLAERKEDEEDFDFSNSKKADIVSALKSTFTDDKIPVLGAITIPELNVNLPILRGVSDYAILMGAGTMKKDQKMGERNYSLTSHHMIDDRLLFGPIINSKNNMPIYLTDLEFVYEYRVSSSAYIQATDVHFIDDHNDRSELTLITCDDTGEGRFMVNAEFIRKTPIEETAQSIIDNFYKDQNLYK